MPREIGDVQYTEKGKFVGNQLGFALLVDANGQPILDAAGNTQVISFKAGTDGRIKTDTKLTGSSMEYYGATVTERPLANTVPVGAVYMAVQTQEMWQSDGTNWVVI